MGYTIKGLRITWAPATRGLCSALRRMSRPTSCRSRDRPPTGSESISQTCRKGASVRRCPDSQTQVTTKYHRAADENITPLRVRTILMSTQNSDDATNKRTRAELMEKVIRKVIPVECCNERTIYRPEGMRASRGVRSSSTRTVCGERMDAAPFRERPGKGRTLGGVRCPLGGEVGRGGLDGRSLSGAGVVRHWSC